MLEFMGNHPVLTFFLAIIIGDTLCTIAKYAFGPSELKGAKEEG